tara:strand:- start:335 stop:934 length:600 start_codon:yes stop_codon:yes gene_type:complete
MRNLILTIIVAMTCTFLMAFTINYASKAIIETVAEDLPSRPVALAVITPEIETPKVNIIIKNHNKFLEDIGMRESSGNYKAVNQYGYLGKYQFGRKTLNALGYKNITNREFLSDSTLQEQAMEDLLVHNKKILRKYINKYQGQIVNGILITESGLLAAAHLAGPGNVKKFLRRGYEFKDGNGTKMTSYMVKFSNYQLDI